MDSKTLSSGAAALATADANWIDVLVVPSQVTIDHVLLQAGNGAGFEWTVDGGKTTHRILADPDGKPLRLALAWLKLWDTKLQIRRLGATDVTGVWASAW